ncbi:MAG: ABC transporter permease [Candidatus Aegiribacteria sp.]|nr:ABC transporter permease [Candidatus Aegiribacteria sp.]
MADKWGIARLVLLMESLVAKDLKVRYKRSVLGFAWFLLKPLFSMVVYYFVFTRILRFGGAIQHFSLFLLTGLLPWNFFSSSLSATTSSLLDNHRLIRSIYFPRMALPAAEVAANLVHLLLALVVLEVVLIIFGHYPGISIVLILPALILLTMMTVGIGMLVSIGNVFYRDVKQFIEVLLLAWFYASPIIYPLDSIGVDIIQSQKLVAILKFNPVSGFMEIMHSIFYAGTWPPLWCWISLGSWSFVLLFIGIAVFRKAEPVVVKEL